MMILHISNGYSDSKVHSNLTRAIDELGIEQVVYCPVREERLIGNNQFEGKHIQFVYSYCIKPWYKYVYQYKRWMLYRDMKRKIDLRGHDVIHAATLFSDGGLALKVHQKYGTPYIVAVRNTDINVYLKRLRYTHHIGRKILLNASRIIFISRGEMNEFIETAFTKPIYDQIKDKILLQPNGVEDYWHKHICHERNKGHEVLYVGDFSPNKNVVRTGQAIMELRKEIGFEDVHLTIIGGEKVGIAFKGDGKTQQIIDEHPEAITALGKIYDKDKLAGVMRSCALFAMPSIHETFGLVYIEALSQNLPVIYTKGQGIDGILDESVGMSVNPLSVEEIKNAMKTILSNPERYGNSKVKFDQFDWNSIARRYVNIYSSLI